jgi:hypothetical protein
VTVKTTFVPTEGAGWSIVLVSERSIVGTGAVATEAKSFPAPSP